jgi:hypothetical protein
VCAGNLAAGVLTGEFGISPNGCVEEAGCLAIGFREPLLAHNIVDHVFVVELKRTLFATRVYPSAKRLRFSREGAPPAPAFCPFVDAPSSAASAG